MTAKIDPFILTAEGQELLFKTRDIVHTLISKTGAVTYEKILEMSRKKINTITEGDIKKCLDRLIQMREIKKTNPRDTSIYRVYTLTHKVKYSVE